MAELPAKELNELTRDFTSSNATWEDRKPILRSIVEKGSTADLETFLGGVAQATGNTPPKTQAQETGVKSEPTKSLRPVVNSDPEKTDEIAESKEAAVAVNPEETGACAITATNAEIVATSMSNQPQKADVKHGRARKGLFRDKFTGPITRLINRLRGTQKVVNLEPTAPGEVGVNSAQTEEDGVNSAPDQGARSCVDTASTTEGTDANTTSQSFGGGDDVGASSQAVGADDQMPSLEILVNELMYFAVVMGKLDMVKFLVETKGANVNCTQDRKWGTPYYAGWDFVDPDPDGPNASPTFGQTALLVAGKKAHFECIKFLLSAGADVNQVDETGSTSLMLAAHTGSPNCVHLLLEAGANAKHTDKYDSTPLACAAYHGCAEYQNVINPHGNHAENQAKRPLSVERKRDKLECTKLLLEAGADPNSISTFGQAPLLRAAWDSVPKCVELLLKSGADVNLKNKHGQTPLMKASWQNASECAELLLEAGAHVNQADNRGWTSLGKSAWQNAPDCMKLLLHAGADVNQADNDGYTPLSSASFKNAPDCVKLLMEAGAEVNHTDNDGRTSLMKAAFQNASDCLKLLLAGGADVNQCDGIGRTPLLNAAWQGADVCSKLLLDAGANVNMADEYGQTALIVAGRQAADDDMQAVQEKQQDVVLKVLLAAGATVNVPCNNKLNCRESGAKLLFAAGEQIITVKQNDNQEAKKFFPPDWNEHKLKNECRKVIRKHLLMLDPHTNLFMRIPQLQMTTKRAGLPDYVVFYLLFHENIEVDHEQLDVSGLKLDA